MTTRPSGGVILVATDRIADANQAQRALAAEFERVEVSTQADLAVADFERVRPHVVVLAFDSLEKSEQYCLGLLRFSKVAQAHPHRHVILCTHDAVHAVFDLCKKDYFDDYVLYWPQAYDGHRLVMAVWNALRRLAASQDQVPNRSEIEAHAQSAHALGAVVEQRLDQGMRHFAAAHASLASAEYEVAKVPANEGVKRALAASRDSLAPVSEWAQGFRADVATHVTDARALARKLQPPRPLVLIVEDDAFAARLIGKALEQQPYDLEFAVDAPGVLALLRRRHPAVILMDINLPGMDGLSLTEWLKASPTLAYIPVMMLTGEAKRETIERSKAAGAAGFIVKPFTREVLLDRLSQVVR
jgi:CheY-like chemotaxis protein